MSPQGRASVPCPTCGLLPGGPVHTCISLGAVLAGAKVLARHLPHHHGPAETTCPECRGVARAMYAAAAGPLFERTRRTITDLRGDIAGAPSGRMRAMSDAQPDEDHESCDPDDGPVALRDEEIDAALADGEPSPPAGG